MIGLIIICMLLFVISFICLFLPIAMLKAENKLNKIEKEVNKDRDKIRSIRKEFIKNYYLNK